MEEEEEEEDEEGGEGKAESHVPLSIYVRSDIPSRVRPTSGEGVRLALARMLVYPLDIYPVGGPQSTYSTWMV